MKEIKPIFWILGIAVVAVVGFLLFGQSTPAGAQGKVVVGITDDATSFQNVTSIMLTVDKVEVLNATGTEGWTTAWSGSKQYDLVQLKQTGAVALLADVNLPVGTYNQIRLTISKVLVTASGTTQEAKLPSGTLKIVGRIVVEEGKTATVVLDFKGDKSIHITGNGKFILAPVVNLQIKSDASVVRESDDTLKIEGGKSEDDVNVGMDEKGDTKDNFELDANAKLEIDSEDVIHIGGQNQSGGSDQNQNKEGTQGNGEMKLNLSSQNNSGIAGTATLQESDGKVKVALKLNGVSTGVAGLLGISLGATHPAHIHTGTCVALGAVKYPLTSTVDGKSDTTVNATLAELKAQMPLAINVHKSDAEIGVYVACADLKF